MILFIAVIHSEILDVRDYFIENDRYVLSDMPTVIVLGYLECVLRITWDPAQAQWGKGP